MLSLGMRFLIFFVLILTFSLISCSPIGKTTVSKNSNISFSQFEITEVYEVVNATGTEVPQNVLDILTYQIKKNLEDRGVLSDETSQDDVLIVRSELLAYGVFKPVTKGMSLRLGGTAKSMCTLRTHLALKTKALPLATVVTTQEAGASLYTSVENFDNRVLIEAAKAVAQRVAEIMQQKGEL